MTANRNHNYKFKREVFFLILCTTPNVTRSGEEDINSLLINASPFAEFPQWLSILFLAQFVGRQIHYWQRVEETSKNRRKEER